MIMEWMSVHVTESASNLPSCRIFTLTSSSSSFVPSSFTPEQTICLNFDYNNDNVLPCKDASHTVRAEVKVTKVAVIPGGSEPKKTYFMLCKDC